jgi:CheY-like chemotaxis protein
MSAKQGLATASMHRKLHSDNTPIIFERLLLKEAFFVADILDPPIITFTNMLQRTLHVAMLEDDSDDRLLTNEILSDLNFDLHIDFFTTSENLIQSLLQKQPNLVLVDFNSTPENGLQVLRRIKSQQDLQGLPVVILSDSDLPQYRTECYTHGASSFITKPKSLDETRKKIRTFFSYWLEVAES